MSTKGKKTVCQRCGRPINVNHSRDTRNCFDCSRATWPPVIEADTQPACNNPAYNPEWWWPTGNAQDASDLAINICRQCHLRAACLDYAIRHKEREGIWGGYMPGERNALAAERRRAS